MATSKIDKTPEQTVTTSSPKEELKIKTNGNENDWYESAFKRFSITLNRSNEKNHPMAKVSRLINPGLQ